MAATGGTTAALASTSSSTASVGSWVDVRAFYSKSLLVRVLNGGSGPTTGCIVSVDLSPDNGSTVYIGVGGSWQAGVGASTEYGQLFPLPADTMYVRVNFSATSQSVTKQADITETTAL